MNASRLLRRLRDAGFEGRADDDELIVVPQTNLTPAISSRIEKHKTDLLDLLDGSSHPTPDETVECIDCGWMLPLSGVRCPSCRDAHSEPACASCGAMIVGPESWLCHLCAVERHVLDMQDAEGRVA